MPVNTKQIAYLLSIFNAADAGKMSEKRCQQEHAERWSAGQMVG